MAWKSHPSYKLRPNSISEVAILNSILIEFEQFQDVSPLFRLLSSGCQPSDPSSAFRMSALWWSVFWEIQVFLQSSWESQLPRSMSKHEVKKIPNAKNKPATFPKTSKQADRSQAYTRHAHLASDWLIWITTDVLAIDK